MLESHIRGAAFDYIEQMDTKILVYFLSYLPSISSFLSF